MTGEATAISAMGSGKNAAEAIHQYLLSKEHQPRMMTVRNLSERSKRD